MKRVLGIGVVGVLCLFAAARGVAVETNELVVVQWNVENLFDTVDDPQNTGDNAYTPRGWERWTDSLYGQKLTNLASVLGPLDADVICVQEVENRRVLEDLCAVLQERHGRAYPYVVHREGPDQRGIDVALIARVEPVSSRWLTPGPDQRDILVVEFAREGQPLTVLVNHWKSRMGKREESDRKRAQQARTARAEVERLLEADPRRALVVLGDFNDEFDGVTLTLGLKSLADRARVLTEAGGPWLYNLHGELAEGARGTLYYKQGKRWNGFDSMSVSRELLGEADDTDGGWRVKPGSYAVVRLPGMLDEEGRPKPFRRDRSQDHAPWPYITGFSDHLPVVVNLECVPAAPAVAATGP